MYIFVGPSRVDNRYETCMGCQRSTVQLHEVLSYDRQDSFRLAAGGANTTRCMVEQVRPLETPRKRTSLLKSRLCCWLALLSHTHGLTGPGYSRVLSRLQRASSSRMASQLDHPRPGSAAALMRQQGGGA
jgi:hypothetical protein